MSNVVEVQPLDNYRIWLRFSDGTQGEVDLSDLAARGVFAAWNDTNVFKEVHVEAGGGIEWPGEIDICPDALYLRLTGKAVEDIFPSLKTTPVIDDELTAQERAELNASLGRALEDSDAGRGMEAWDYLKRYRAAERCAEPNLRPEEAADLNRRWTDHVQRPESAIPWEEARRKLRDRE